MHLTRDILISESVVPLGPIITHLFAQQTYRVLIAKKNMVAVQMPKMDLSGRQCFDIYRSWLIYLLFVEEKMMDELVSTCYRDLVSFHRILSKVV